MTDWVNLGIIVVLGYGAIVYGPGIVANIQAGQPPLAGVVPTANAQLCPDGTAPAADGSCPSAPAAPATPVDQATTAAFQPQALLFDSGIIPGSPPPAAGCKPGLVPNFFGQCGAPFVAPTTPAPPQPTTLNSPKTTSFKYANQKCVPGTGPGTGSACVPIIGGPNTRPAKKATPPHATKNSNPNCVTPCVNGFCIDKTTASSKPCKTVAAVGYSQGYNIPRMGPEWYSFEKSNVYQANMTQVVDGKSVTTIDPYFPGGFFLVEAGRKASRHEPALH